MNEVSHKDLTSMEKENQDGYFVEVNINHLYEHWRDDAHENASYLPVAMRDVNRYFHYHLLFPSLQVVEIVNRLEKSNKDQSIVPTAVKRLGD